MAEKLKDTIDNYSNEKLLQEYYRNRAEWSDEALEIMKDEIAQRAISAEELSPYLQDPQSEQPEAEPDVYKKEEFVPFEYLFSQIDMLLVSSIFLEAKLPFYVDNPPSERVLPMESQSSKCIRIHVHKDFLSRAHELIDEHFHPEEGVYRLKFTDIHQRMRAFSFNEIQLSDSELYDKVDVTFTAEESQIITGFARRLQTEIDTIEADRTVFYFDNLDDLIDILSTGSRKTLRKMDLLTVIELLQIYNDDPAFSPAIHEAAGALMDFFMVNM